MAKENKNTAVTARAWKYAIAAALALAVAGVIGFAAWRNHKNFVAGHMASEKREMLEAARAAARNLESYIDEHLIDLKILASMPSIGEQAHNKTKWSESDTGFCIFTDFYGLHKNNVDALYLIDSDGMVLHRDPFVKEKIGMSLRGKPGVDYVLKNHELHVSNMYYNKQNKPSISISVPVFQDSEFVGMVRWMTKMTTIIKHYIQPVKIGENGYTMLLNDNGTIYHHPRKELIGKNIEKLQKENFGDEEKKEIEVIGSIIKGNEGTAHFTWDELSPEKSCFAWTYVSIIPKASGTAGIKLRYDKKVSGYFREKKARIVGSELDKKIPRLKNLVSTDFLKDILETMMEEYPEIVEISIHGPRSEQDKILVYKTSTSPGLEGKLSDQEDVQAVKDDRYSIDFVKQKPGRPHAGEDVIDVTVPIHTSEEIWPIVVTKPYSEIVGPINRNARNMFGLAGIIILLFGTVGFALYKSKKRKALLAQQAEYIAVQREIQEELREKNESYDRIIDNADKAIFRVKAEGGQVISVNPAGERLMGYSQEECLADPGLGLKIIHPDYAEKQKKIIEQINTTKKTIKNVELGWITKDGREVIVEYTIIPVMDEEGRIIYLESIGRDITERKKAEEELRKSEMFLKEAQRIGHVGSWDLNIVTGDLYWSDETYRIYGFKPQEFVPTYEKFLSALHPDDKNNLQEKVNDALQNKRDYNMDFRFVRPNKETGWIHCEGEVTRDKKGKAIRFFGTQIDITERKKAEEELRLRSEIIINMSEGVYLVRESDGIIVYTNPRFEEMFGYSHGEMVGKHVSIVNAPTDKNPEETASEFIEFMNKNGEWQGEVENIKSDGTRFWCYASITRFDHPDHGKVLVTVHTDITDRKKAESKLIESVARYRELSDSISDVFFAMDENLRYTYWNKASEKQTGIPSKNAIGKSLYEIFPDVRGTKIPKNFLKVLESQKPQSFTNEYQLDGKTYFFEVRVYPSKDGISVFQADVTESKKTEKAFIESERKYRSFVQNFQGMAFYGDLNFKPFFFHGAVEEITGYREQDFTDGKPRWEEIVYPDDREIFAGHSVKGIRTIPDYSDKREYRIIRKDGQVRWVYEAIQNVCDESGKPAFVQGIIHDITSRKKTEEEKDNLEKQLRQAEKMEAIGQLAGGIAHDFNNQLGGIMGYADMIRESVPDDPTLSRYADNIIISTKRAADLTEQLLAFARKGKYVSVPVNMHKIIGEVVSMIRHSIDKKITITQHLAANPPMTTGDSTQLQNALLNMAINASDAMPEGGEITFTTNVVDIDKKYCKKLPYKIKPGRYLEICVNDTGMGIDKETRKHIFEPFYTTKETGKGTGMGLAAVYGTVKNHKGAIEVNSKVGRGTTFKIYLPLLEDTAESEDFKGTVPAIRGSACILVVEDEEFMRRALLDMLKSLGHTVTACKDGAEAVEYYRKHWKKIDLVILDMVMPNMGGREAFIAMRKINPKIIALLSSGYSMDGEAKEIIDEGVKGFIQKPFGKAGLSTVVADTLGI